MKAFFKMFVIVLILALALPTVAQTTKTQRMGVLESFIAQRHSLQKQGRTAFDKEIEREKIEPCPEARSEFEQNVCLEKEIEITENDYKTYAASVRALLVLEPPVDNLSDNSGPAGKSLTGIELLKEFDNVQSLWEQYRKAAADASYDYYKGGSMAPILSGRAELKIIRNHMHELDAIYAMILQP